MQALLQRAARHELVTIVDEKTCRAHMARARTRVEQRKIQRIGYSTLEVRDREDCTFTANRHGQADDSGWRDYVVCTGPVVVVLARRIDVIAHPEDSGLPPLRLPLDTAVCVPETAMPYPEDRILPNLALVTTRRTRTAAVEDVTAMVREFLKLTVAGGLDTDDASREFAAAGLAVCRGDR